MSFQGLPLRNAMSHVVCPRGPSWDHSNIDINGFTQFINLCKVVLYTDTILQVTDNDLDIIVKHTHGPDSESAQHWFKCKWMHLNSI